MISQRCPKCNSSRVRAGYRPTPLWSKLLFRYNLLCNNCNWEFRGFAVPGTVSSNPKRNKKKQFDSASIPKPRTEVIQSVNNEETELAENNKIIISDSQRVKIKKRVKVRL